MTTARLTKRRNKLEKQTDAVLDALVIDNLTQEQVAERFKVSAAAVSKFVARHSVELVAQQEAIQQAAIAYRIAIKEERIAEAARDYDNISAWEAEHGLSERTVRYDRDGNEVGETIRFRRDLVDAKRAIRREVAEELGQLPKTSDTTINNNLVLIRQYNGETEAI